MYDAHHRRLYCCKFFLSCGHLCLSFFFLFFFNDTATTEIYTLSLHDALPISRGWPTAGTWDSTGLLSDTARSEEHTSELQSLAYLVCRLLLEKKKHITSHSPPSRASEQFITLNNTAN